MAILSALILLLNGYYIPLPQRDNAVIVHNVICNADFPTFVNFETYDLIGEVSLETKIINGAQVDTLLIILNEITNTQPIIPDLPSFLCDFRLMLRITAAEKELLVGMNTFGKYICINSNCYEAPKEVVSYLCNITSKKDCFCS